MMERKLDPECFNLACYFLDECKDVTDAKRNELARRIQQTVDDYGQYLLDEAESRFESYIDSKWGMA